MRRSQKGFTLIEVMIVVAIIAIIFALALPSYSQYVERSRRAAAASYLLEVANLQEEYFLDNRAYALDETELGLTVPAEVSANYTITVVGDNGTTPPSYDITATAQGAQASDDCGNLTLDELGTKGHKAGGTRCWQ